MLRWDPNCSPPELSLSRRRQNMRGKGWRPSKKWHSHFFKWDCTKASSRSRRHKFRIIRIPINGNANSLHCSSSPIKPKVLWGPREIVGEAFVRSVISEVHAPGNDGIQFYSVAISALSAAALRRLRSETRLRAQFGRRNSLQEDFFDKQRRPGAQAPGRLPIKSKIEKEKRLTPRTSGRRRWAWARRTCPPAAPGRRWDSGGRPWRGLRRCGRPGPSPSCLRWSPPAPSGA